MPRLVFTVQPTRGTRGRPLQPGVRLSVVDAWGQPDSTISGLAAASVVGTHHGASSPVVNGEIDFPNLMVTAPGTFRIRVQLGGAAPVLSQPFDVVP